MHFDQGIWIIGGGGIDLALADKYRQANVDVKLVSRPEYDIT